MNQNNIKKSLFYSLTFIVNPILGIFLSIISSLHAKASGWCVLTAVLCSLYMAALNTTKVPASDEVRYIEQFQKVPQNGIVGTLKFFSDDGDSIKEPSYGLIVCCLYYFTIGLPNLFIAIQSFIIYFFFFYGIYRIQKENDAPNYIIISGIVIVTFFTQYFTLTAHLIRQLMATSVFFYALSYRKSSILKYCVLSVLSFSIHSSMIVLILMSFLPGVTNFYSKKSLTIVGLFVFIISLIFPSIAASIIAKIALGGDIGAALVRASAADGLNDGGEGVSMAIVLFITAPLLLISFYSLLVHNKSVPPVIFNLCLLMSIFVLNLSFSPLLQYRFFYYLYYFIPLVLLVPFRAYPNLSKIYCAFLCFFMFIRFYLSYSTGVFKYANPLEALFLPYPMLFNF